MEAIIDCNPFSVTLSALQNAAHLAIVLMAIKISCMCDENDEVWSDFIDTNVFVVGVK